eukprot:scaffold3.g6550.t1
MGFTLAKNQEAAPCSAASGAWLEVAPRGAYTTARTVGGSSVFELSFHIERLASSARLMLDASVSEHREHAVALRALHSGTAGDPHWLRPRVLASLRAAVAAHRQGAEAEAAAASSISNGNGTSASSDSSVQQPTELKLSVLVTWDMTGVDVWSHVEPLPPLPAPPVKCQVRGAPRANAAAKDSEWVRERKALEATKAPDANEVLLSCDDGCVYEGLTSNFFAVVAGAVHTAGGGVLAGSVRKLILEVARREGLPVVLSPPRLSDLDAWEGCFLSSTSRLLLPIDELLLPAPGGLLDGPPLPAGRGRCFLRGGVVGRLEQRVLAEVQACSEPL